MAKKKVSKKKAVKKKAAAKPVKQKHGVAEEQTFLQARDRFKKEQAEAFQKRFPR